MDDSLDVKLRDLARKAAHADVAHGDNNVGAMTLDLLAKAFKARLDNPRDKDAMRKALWDSLTPEERDWLDDSWPQEWR